jgi:fluoride ion exporter CrcB/FEX
MFLPLGTLLILIAGAFMIGMLTAFIMVIRAMMRFKK